MKTDAYNVVPKTDAYKVGGGVVQKPVVSNPRPPSGEACRF